MGSYLPIIRIDSGNVREWPIVRLFDLPIVINLQSRFLRVRGLYDPRCNNVGGFSGKSENLKNFFQKRKMETPEH